MKFVRLSTKYFQFFFATIVLFNLIFTKKPEKSEADKLKEKINPMPKKTSYEKMLKNIEFLEIEKNQKFSVAKKDMKVKTKNLKFKI